MDDSIDRSIAIRRLMQWAFWKMNSGVNLGFKKEVSFLRLAVDKSRAPDCSDPAFDAECVQTNEAVEALPDLHKLVVDIEYLRTENTAALKAHRMGVSKRQYEQYRNAVHDLVANILNTRLHNLRTNDINRVGYL